MLVLVLVLRPHLRKEEDNLSNCNLGFTPVIFEDAESCQDMFWLSVLVLSWFCVWRYTLLSVGQVCKNLRIYVGSENLILS